MACFAELPAVHEQQITRHQRALTSIPDLLPLNPGIAPRGMCVKTIQHSDHDYDGAMQACATELTLPAGEAVGQATLAQAQNAVEWQQLGL